MNKRWQTRNEYQLNSLENVTVLHTNNARVNLPTDMRS